MNCTYYMYFVPLFNWTRRNSGSCCQWLRPFLECRKYSFCYVAETFAAAKLSAIGNGNRILWA